MDVTKEAECCGSQGAFHGGDGDDDDDDLQVDNNRLLLRSLWVRRREGGRGIVTIVTAYLVFIPDVMT